jgi:hypothetical protein
MDEMFSTLIIRTSPCRASIFDGSNLKLLAVIVIDFSQHSVVLTPTGAWVPAQDTMTTSAANRTTPLV